MKEILRAAVLLPVAAIALGMGTGCKPKTQPSPDVWALVNGQEIKRDEVEKYYRTRVNPEGQEPSQEEVLSLKLNVLEELINNEILLERAKKLNLEASDGEVEDKFTERKSPYTEDEFQRQLKDRPAEGALDYEAAEPRSGGENINHRPGRHRRLQCEQGAI
jgi:peptidyl-prolyl cis-trans isomerase SurA